MFNNNPSEPEQELSKEQDSSEQFAADFSVDEDAAASSPSSGEAAVDGASAFFADQDRLQQELQQANDRAVRWQAELENYRKRARREMEDERRYAALPLLVDILGVVDNLDRAIEASEGNSQAAGLSEGVKMVATQLAGVLAKHHCYPVEALGKPFDPHMHEALMEMPSEEFDAGNVCRVARQGYRLHDRVVRPAQVLVSKGPGPSGAGAASPNR
jgi:molecular chaperone GrpE